MRRNAGCQTAIISKAFLAVQNHIYCNATWRPQDGQRNKYCGYGHSWQNGINCALQQHSHLSFWQHQSTRDPSTISLQHDYKGKESLVSFLTETPETIQSFLTSVPEPPPFCPHLKFPAESPLFQLPLILATNFLWNVFTLQHKDMFHT